MIKESFENLLTTIGFFGIIFGYLFYAIVCCIFFLLSLALFTSPIWLIIWLTTLFN